jgi:hypothetical protein
MTSRSHLYRGGAGPRPFATILALALWLGAAALVLVVRGPALLAGQASVGAADASLLQGLFSAGIAIVVVVVAAELLAGRTRGRAARLALATIVLASCTAGQFAAAGPANALRLAWVRAAAAAAMPSPEQVAAVTSLHQRAVLWLGIGAVAAAIALGLAVASVRSWERRA